MLILDLLSGFRAVLQKLGLGLVQLVRQGGSDLSKKEGSAPRFVGDSTVSGANLLCRIGERIEMPPTSGC